MDFTISRKIEQLRAEVSDFVEAEILPVERDRANWDRHGNIGAAALKRLRTKAQMAGLWCLQLAEETGGRGLSRVGMAVCYEEMNSSIFGPVVFNSAAPDDGYIMGRE